MTLQSPISFIQKARQSFPSRDSTWLLKILLAISCHGNRKRESIKCLQSQQLQGWEKCSEKRRKKMPKTSRPIVMAARCKCTYDEGHIVTAHSPMQCRTSLIVVIIFAKNCITQLQQRLHCGALREHVAHLPLDAAGAHDSRSEDDGKVE